MFPPIFQIAAANTGVTALIGSSPVRLYPAGRAPQGVTYPYAVWQTVAGAPQNLIDDVPATDRFTVQVDAYAKTATDARSVAKALRDALERHAYVVSWRGESVDSETGSYRFSFDMDWLVHR